MGGCLNVRVNVKVREWNEDVCGWVWMYAAAWGCGRVCVDLGVCGCVYGCGVVCIDV